MGLAKSLSLSSPRRQEFETELKNTAVGFLMHGNADNLEEILKALKRFNKFLQNTIDNLLNITRYCFAKNTFKLKSN